MGDFGRKAAQYDRWYDEHRAVYLSELSSQPVDLGKPEPATARDFSR